MLTKKGRYEEKQKEINEVRCGAEKEENKENKEKIKKKTMKKIRRK
jgi:hypothetical protein